MEFDTAAMMARLEEFRGTPHVPRRREPGRGIDCIGLVMESLHSATILPPVTLPQYSQGVGLGRGRNIMADLFLRFCNTVTIPLTGWQPQPSDIAIFSVGRYSNHIGIVAPDGKLWHVTNTMTARPCSVEGWRGRLQEAIRFTAAGFRESIENLKLE